MIVNSKINRKINKRGMIFTILAITILSLFLVSYSVYSITQDRKSINKRVETLNNFVFSVEEDLPRQLYVTGFRIIFILEKEISDTGDYINDLDSLFQELFFNGTLSGELEELMNGVKFQDIIDLLNERGKKINANVSLRNPEINIIQSDPWNVNISLEANLLIQDESNLVLWNRSISINSYIPIENFEDPIYLVNTKGLVPNKIYKTIFDDFVNGSDVSNLLAHVQNSYYINNSDAPSFLDRLEGNLSANENGIESLVYLPDLTSRGISVKSKSVVDHIYFSDDNPTSYQISGMPSWFKIDDEHLDEYEVEGLIS